MYFVYIFQCAYGEFYTGCTNNLEERLKRHNAGHVHFTKDKLPVKLVTYIAFTDKYKAFEFEKYLKSGSGRAFARKKTEVVTKPNFNHLIYSKFGVRHR